jgi:hypothetical protein
MAISRVRAAHGSRLLRTTKFLFLVFTLFISASVTSAATLVVPAGGDLQAAINSAVPGDTIVLAAGATYRGPFTLPKKSGDAYITIQSSRASEIVGRVSPSQRALLASLRSSVGGDPIIRTASGAHHYKLIGLEISTFSATDLIYDLIRLGDSNQTVLANVPHHLILDRLWIHGFPTQPVQRGVSLNSAETTITNSYISDIHMVGFDTQAICGWNGPGPFHIINNYLEAAGENIMFGGSPPAISNLVPANIEIRRNYLFKPLSWKVGHSTYAGIHWGIKNLLEFKNARNVVVDGNVMENSWTDAQIGYAVLFTVRSEEGRSPWATVENISFTNNTVKNTEQGLQLLGSDYPYQSGRGNGLVIANNLFTGIANRFLTISGFYNVSINHNTHIQNGNVTALHSEPSIGFVYTNNITVRSGYGFFGDSVGEGSAALATYTPGYVFRRNVIAGGVSRVYPTDNFFPSSISGLLDSTYRLASSTYTSAGTDGKALGCDINALNAAQSGSGSADVPAPSPSPSETILLADDFNDSSLNTSKWLANNLFSGFTDSTVTISETTALAIGPLKQNTNGSHYNGIRSRASFNFTGGYAFVQLVQPPNALTTADAFLTLGLNVDNCYRIYLEFGSLVLQRKIGGAKTAMLTTTFNSASHAFWRIRHDSVSGQIVFETAPHAGSGMPGSWTQLYAEPWNTSAVPLSTVLFELKAGTWRIEGANPGTVVFDNFRAGRL